MIKIRALVKEQDQIDWKGQEWKYSINNSTFVLQVCDIKKTSKHFFIVWKSLDDLKTIIYHFILVKKKQLY